MVLAQLRLAWFPPSAHPTPPPAHPFPLSVNYIGGVRNRGSQLWHKSWLHFFWTTCWLHCILYHTYMRGESPPTPRSIGVMVFSDPPVFRRVSKKASWIFFRAGLRCSGLPKTPTNWAQNFRPLYFHAYFQSSGLPSTPKNWISDFFHGRSSVFWSSEDL